MKVKLIIISVILLLVAVFVCGCSQFMENIGLINPTNEEQLSPEKSGPPDGLVKVLIGFKEKPGPAEQALVHSVSGTIKYTYHIIPVIAATVPEGAIAALQANRSVVYVEPDALVHTLDELANSWGVDRIDAEVVHATNKGTEVKVAIIDTGIDYEHIDLDDNYVSGVDIGDGDVDPMDDSDIAGHGTHVAGIVAAEDNDPDAGVIGVAPEAHLYAVKVFDSEGIAYDSDVIAGIEWCMGYWLDLDGDDEVDTGDYGSEQGVTVDVINMSIGRPGSSKSLEDACDAAYAAEIVLVAAAGNGFRIIPAAFDSVIAVAASDSNDKIPGWSSKGSYIELTAPGVAVISTLPGDTYGEGSGTSMASPHVAGTAALVWAVNPAWSNSAVRTQLRDTAERLMRNANAEYPDSWQGYGLVDAEKAVLGTETGDN